jgi:hypothetical protein
MQPLHILNILLHGHQLIYTLAFFQQTKYFFGWLLLL